MPPKTCEINIKCLMIKQKIVRVKRCLKINEILNYGLNFVSFSFCCSFYQIGLFLFSQKIIHLFCSFPFLHLSAFILVLCHVHCALSPREMHQVSQRMVLFSCPQCGHLLFHCFSILGHYCFPKCRMQHSSEILFFPPSKTTIYTLLQYLINTQAQS